MRAVALLVAMVVLAPAAIGSSAPARAQSGSIAADFRPHLMPPDPLTGTWPPGVVQGTPPSAPHPVATTGVAKILVLLIQFTNVSHDPTHDSSYFDDFFNNASTASRSLRAYYQESSYGSLTTNATIFPTWLTSTQTMEHYGRDSATGVDDATAKIYSLVVEAVQAANASLDFRTFDTDRDGIVDHLVVVHAGLGQENHANMTDLIWSHSWAVLDADLSQPGDQPLLADGVQVSGYTMISEASPVGVMAHEFAHDLGLRDLYDTDLSSDGAGVWDVMALGAWNGAPRGSSPAEFSAWSKIRLGWLAPTNALDALEDTAIPAVEMRPFALRLSIPSIFPEYFLLENREAIGFDAGLPRGGLLIWHVDDSRTNNDDDAHRLLDLVEADEGISGDRPTDAGDPWHDTAIGFGPDTNPSNVAYDGLPTKWRVRDISSSGPNMTATLLYSVPVDMAVQEIRVPSMAALGASVTAEVIVRNEGSLAANTSLTVGVYLGRLAPASLILQENRTGIALAAGGSVPVQFTFSATALGRYLIDAAVATPNDAIASDDERVAHVSTNIFAFRDDMEAGGGNWTVGGAPQDNPRWSILAASDPNGSARSGSLAWRFGYVSNNTTSPATPDWRILTSPIANLTGPSYLIFYHRFDLSNATDPGSIGTGRASVEVRYGAGPWYALEGFGGRSLDWVGESIALQPPSFPTTVQARFNATAGNMPNRGGWWIDDVAIASRGLGFGVVLLPRTLSLSATAGSSVVTNLKIVNVGDYEYRFDLNASVPGGWIALWAPPGGGLPLSPTRDAWLAPDRDATVGLVVIVPLSAAAGEYNGTLTATAVLPGVTASVPLTILIQGSRTSEFPVMIAIAAAIAGVTAIVGVLFLRRRARRPPS